MKPIERSAILRKEADELLKQTKLEELCRVIGPITPTGSYFIDLMMYPDIDLYLPPTQPRNLFNLAASLVEDHAVIRVNFLNGGPGPLKDAYYLKPVIAIGEWERPWKIDIWSVNQNFIDSQNHILRDLKRRMTPKQREIILNYKFSILTEEGRTPMFSGIHIYHAVVDHGLVRFPEITRYLRKQSIQI